MLNRANGLSFLVLVLVPVLAQSQPQDDFPLGVFLFGYTDGVNFTTIANDLNATWVQGYGGNGSGIDGHELIEINPGNLKVASTRWRLKQYAISHHMFYQAERDIPSPGEENLWNYFEIAEGETDDPNALHFEPGSTNPGIVISGPRPNDNFPTGAINYIATFRMRIDKNGVNPNDVAVNIDIDYLVDNIVRNTFPRTLKVSDFTATLVDQDFEVDFDLESCFPQCSESDTAGYLTSGMTQRNSIIEPLSSINIRVSWPGIVDTWLDYVIVDDLKSNDLFAGVYDAQIDDEVADFISNPNYDLVQRFYANDEPSTPEFLPFDYIDSYLESDFPDARGRLITATFYSPFSYGNLLDRWNADGRSHEIFFDQYVISNTVPSPTMVNPADLHVEVYESNAQYDALLQPKWDLLENGIGSTAENLLGVKPFWFIPQLHGEYIVGSGGYQKTDESNALRPPTGEEISAEIGIALSFGARGIFGYPHGTDYVDFFGGSDAYMTGLVSPTQSHLTNVQLLPGPTGDKSVYTGYQEKWDALSEVYEGLGRITDDLLMLSWVGAKSWYSGIEHGEWVAPPISSVETKAVSGTQFDPVTEVLVGHLEGTDGKDYLCVVNRRCDPTNGVDIRDIHLTFDFSQSEIQVTNIETNEDWIIDGSGTLVDRFEPGEFKIYRVGSVDLLDLASRGKSTSSNALQTNSQRKTIRESDGTLHAVFGSGGRIFYQRFPSSGSTPEQTAELTSGSVDDTYPSIASRGENI